MLCFLVLRYKRAIYWHVTRIVVVFYTDANSIQSRSNRVFTISSAQSQFTCWCCQLKTNIRGESDAIDAIT